MQREEKRQKLEYAENLKGKTEDEKLAVSYFYNILKSKGYWSKNKIVPMVTDAQYDELVSKRAEEITSQSVLAALGLSSPPPWIMDPFKVCTPEFQDAEYVKMGADLKARSSRISTTFIFYASTVMYVYSRTVSLTDHYCREFATSIMYKDISSVSLTTETHEARHDVIEPGGCFRKAKEVSVWIPGTTNKIEFTIPGKTIEVNVGGAKTVMTSEIANLRSIIAKCK